jgi:aminobenzoyl-glutamate utilization protein B
VLAEAKRTFKEELGGVEYKSMLPAEQKPPVALNRAIMEKFRPEMRKHYLNERPEFS